MSTSVQRRMQRGGISWHLVVGLVLGVGVLAIGILALMVSWRPAWYEPAAVNHAQLRTDKTALVRLQEEISRALNADRPAQWVLDEAQVNRWIRARGYLWPEADVQLGPVQDVQVRLQADAVRIGALVDWGGWRVVVSLAAAVHVHDEAIEIRCTSLRCGALPVPSGWLGDLLSELRFRDGIAPDPTRPGAFVVRNDWTWPNGRRRCRLDALVFEGDTAVVTLAPLGPRRAW